MDYTPPAYEAKAFHCPYCHTYAQQTWSAVFASLPYGTSPAPGFMMNQCSHCERWAIWFEERIIFPLLSDAPEPSPDMPAEVAADFNEARTLVMLSPRASAALLRLAIQKLCIHLGQPGENLNHDIGALVRRGLPVRVQQSLDIVRVIGNNAVHPGQIDLGDDATTAITLFSLINLIVEQVITFPRHVDAVYGGLPEAARQAIERRDQPR